MVKTMYQLTENVFINPINVLVVGLIKVPSYLATTSGYTINANPGPGDTTLETSCQ